jgi:transcription elongation factor S-II
MAAAASSPATASPAPSHDLKGFTGDVKTRRWETEKVDTKRTGYPNRDACVGLIYNGLAYMSYESSTSIIVRAMEIEEAAFKEYKGETPEYRAKLRSLFQNLKAASNRDLAPSIMRGEITPARFVVMSHDDLKSESRRKQDEKLENENMKKAQVPMAEKSISDALRCGKCGQKKVSYSQAQTRSADEPMTTFCECTVCGNRWKVGLKEEPDLVIAYLCSSPEPAKAVVARYTICKWFVPINHQRSVTAFPCLTSR